MTILNEDGLELPVWLEYKKKFTYQNKQEAFQVRIQINTFIKSHPYLRLIHVDMGEQTITVSKDKSLFKADDSVYYEKTYDFTRTILTYYFNPHPDLHEYLVMLQEFINSQRRRLLRINKKRS